MRRDAPRVECPRLTRVHVVSDVHCEFDDYRLEETDAEVVVLAGDVNHGLKGLEWARACFPSQDIVYVAGNHEYYGEALPRLTDKLRERATSLGIAFLDNDAVELAGLRFLGCTLWSDLQLFGSHPWIFDAVLNTMVDYHTIRVSPQYRRLRPADTMRMHRASVNWLRQYAGRLDSRSIVVTHHAPSVRSISPKFAEHSVSAAYASHLDALVAELGAGLWIHGHTHHNVDYTIGTTRVVSNQLGYPDEEIGFVPDLVIDVR